MKIIGKIIAGIVFGSILLFALVVGAFMIFKPDLVRAVYDGFVLNTEQIEEKKKENDKQLVNTIKDFGLNISQEDLRKLENGEISQEEIKNLLLGQNPEQTIPGENTQTVDNNDKQNDPDKTQKEEINIQVNDKQEDVENQETSKSEVKPEPKPEPRPDEEKQYQVQEQTSTQTNPEGDKENEPKDDTSSTDVSKEEIKKYEEKTAELVARMYTLKAQYIGQINSVVDSMIAEYKALPKEQRTTASKTRIANKYLGTISSLEAQCDAQVNAIVKELREVLQKSGKDMTLADAVIEAYNNEKETTKAAYISKYTN